MARELRFGAAILAAGASRRFGEEDKLAAPFRGRMLGEHVCTAIGEQSFALRLVIAPRLGHPCEKTWENAGFEVHVNAHAKKGMGTSVALAARLAREAGCDGLTIALADMPLVPASHFVALADKLGELGSDALICSARQDTRLPPAIFGADRFGELAALKGDEGARMLLRDANVVDCPPGWLLDIDTPGDLAQLQ